MRRLWIDNTIVRHYGGVVAPDEFDGSDRKILEYSQRVVHTTRGQLAQLMGSLSRLDFAFVAGRQANAFVLRAGRRHLISFCVGLPIRVKRMLDRAMKVADFLPKYLTVHERPEWSWQYLGQIVEHAYLHEAAHALRGHFCYLDRGRSAPTQLCLDEGTRQCGHYIELDADLHALDMWADITLKADYFPRAANLREDLYFQRLLTLLLFYQALDAHNAPIAHFANLDHPPPVQRAMLLSEAMLASSSSVFGLERSEVENAHQQAHWESSVVARAAGRLRNRWWGESGANRGNAIYARRRRYYLNVFEPRLDAFGKTMPNDVV